MSESLEDILESGKSKKQKAEDLKEAIAYAERAGYTVSRPKPKDYDVRTLDIEALTGKDRLKLAVVSCTHFGSKYQQVTALREFCAYAAKQKVDAFVHAGDLEDGPIARHKNPHEMFKHDYGAMLDYCVATLPQTGKPWYIISGNHDDWWLADGGPNLIATLCERRDDLTFLGNSLGYLTFKDTLIEVYHMDSGSAYAYSYKLQKHIESLAPERKPSVCLMGNFHKLCLVTYRSVLGIQLPSFQAQSAWMAGKSLVSEIAGVILDVGLHPKGLAPTTKIEIVQTFVPRPDDWP